MALPEGRLRRPVDLFQLDERFIKVGPSAAAPGEIDIAIKGPWLHTILFEVPLLAIVSELYFRNTQPRPNLDEGRRRLRAKIEQINAVSDPEFRIADYGTRRRFSGRWQEEVLLALKSGIGPKFVGTSNVYFALQHGLTPLGTMAHEYLQACQAVGPRLRDSQVFAFNTWAREYRGDLGIALSDVCGMDAFLRDFDLFFCKLFDGVRHDSGDPFEWGEKLIKHYQKMRIDPRPRRWSSPIRSTCRRDQALRVLAGAQPDRVRHRHQLHQRPGYRPLQIGSR